MSFTDRKFNWFLLLALKLCNDKLVLKISTLLIKNITNEELHKLCTGKICSFTNQPLQKHLGYIPNIVLNIFFLWLNCTKIVFKILSGNGKSAKYTPLNVSMYSIWTSFLIIKQMKISLFSTSFICIFHVYIQLASWPDSSVAIVLGK